MPLGKEKTPSTVQVGMRNTQTSRKASTTQGSEKPAKHALSDVSSLSETSFDTSHLTDELGSIKKQLSDLPTKTDIDSLKESLVGKEELKIVVTDIVKSLFIAFEDRIQKEVDKRVSDVREEYENKFKAMEIENEKLVKDLRSLKDTNSKLKREVNSNTNHAQEAIKMANFNEQYSRKNNIKIFNLRTTVNQDLRKDLVDLVESDLGLQLNQRDITAIHRIPSKNMEHRDKPVIVRFSSYEVKQQLMRQKKNLKDDVRFTDDVTKKNLDLIKQIRECEEMESAWYFNTSVYGKTKDGLQIKFELFDNIEQRIREGQETKG